MQTGTLCRFDDFEKRASPEKHQIVKPTHVRFQSSLQPALTDGRTPAENAQDYSTATHTLRNRCAPGLRSLHSQVFFADDFVQFARGDVKSGYP